MHTSLPRSLGPTKGRRGREGGGGGMHTCIHTYIHTYIHTCMHAYIYTCMHAYICVCVCMYVYIYIYIYNMDIIPETTRPRRDPIAWDGV